MSWPGTPTSQQSPTVNKPSTRTPPVLSENSTMADVAEAMGKAFEGLTVHEQAFAAIPSQVSSAASSAATTAATEVVNSQTTEGVTSFNALTGAIIYFPNLGQVNNQLGVASYTALQGDSGGKIIVGDSSAVTIQLDSSLSAPWFTIIDNDSSTIASLVTVSRSAIYGDSLIYPNCFGLVYFDGTNFWSGSTPIATGSSLGIVQPDNVTINVDSSGTLHVPIALDSSFGIARPDNVTITVDSGVFSIPIATTSTLGVVKPDGSTITVTSGGVISSSGSGTSGVMYSSSNFTTSESTSAQALKGTIAKAVQSSTLYAIFANVYATAGSVYEANVYRITGTSTIAAILGPSSSVTFATTQTGYVIFKFSSPIALVAGTTYAFVINIISGTGTTSCQIDFPTATWSCAGMVVSTDAICDSLINPVVGTTLVTTSPSVSLNLILQF